jgi:hypothetical protein
MKKIFLLLLLISGKVCFAQVPFYDALELRKFNPSDTKGVLTFPDTSGLVVAKTLRLYSKATDYAGIEKDFSTNPFIRLPKDTDQSEAGSVKALVNDVVSGAGGLNVTNLADGFARFLVKRTKEELNAAFFSKFAELINDKRYRDAQLLFPQTYLTLKAIGSEAYNYEAYLNALRESFEVDLNGLLPNLGRVINDGSHAEFFSQQPALKSLCLSAIYIGTQLQNKVHPGQIIADFPTDEIFAHKSLVDVKASVRMFQLLSESLKSKDPSRYWIGGDSLRLLTNDRITLRIYLGLVYQHADTIVVSGSEKSVGQIMKKVYENAERAEGFLVAVKTYVSGFQQQAETVVASIKNLKAKNGTKLEFTDFYAVYSSSLDLIEYTSTLYKVPGFEAYKPSPKLEKKIAVARAGATIALDINLRNYSSAVINLYQLYSNAVDTTSTSVIKPFILKYGSFMAAMAQAENSEEVAAAIEAVALPPGSARIKRQTPFNVSLNSYAGLFLGYEHVKGVDNDGFKFNSYGVTAPIGVAISTGNNKRGSLSLFLSVVDIGALAAFRFSNDSTSSVPDVELKDIISPGIFLSYGIPKTPLSINAGYQGGPLLRKVTADINEYQDSYGRLSISLCVDIPIINFYTRSRKD